MNFQTIEVRHQGPICWVQMNRPETGNVINSSLVEEIDYVLSELCGQSTIVVLEGTPETFCLGADFRQLHAQLQQEAAANDPEPLYDLWMKWATGPYITVSHVRGKANAGGIGFVAASDIVIADASARFSLSEMLFGLLPACVMPFLIRRIGLQRANYMTLTTSPIDPEQARQWGLVDAYEANSAALLRRHLLRLKQLPRKAIERHKRYLHADGHSLLQAKSAALAANREVFADPENLQRIVRYVETGLLPWEE